MAAEKDIVVVIPTNNPGKILLFVELNPRLKDVIDVKPLSDYGGFGNKEFLKISPQNLVPVMLTAGGMRLFESDVILHYLADKYADRLDVTGLGATPEVRALSSQLVAIHNQYISGVNCTQPEFYSNQAIVYKPDVPAKERAARMKDFNKQLDLIEGLLVDGGPFVTGDAITFADISLYPTLAMFEDIAAMSLMGKMSEGRPKIAAWLAHCGSLPAFRGVADQINGFFVKMLGKNIEKAKTAAAAAS